MDQIFGFCAQGALKYTPTPKQGHLQQEDDEVYVHSPNVHLEEMDENDGGNSYYNGSNWNNCWREDSIPTTMHQDTQIETDEQRRGKRVLENETSQSSKSASVESNKKAGGVVALTEKLDSMLLLMGDRGVERKEMNVLAMNVLNSMATPKHNEVTDVVAKLCALPNLEPGNPEFFFACTLIEDPVKRSVLFGLPNDKLKVDYIKYLYERANH